jgi:hypothetical protein
MALGRAGRRPPVGHRTLVDLDGDLPVWSDPKTARGRRSIALDPGTVAALRAQRVAQAQERLMSGAEYLDHDLVFARPDGRPWHPERFSRTSTGQAPGTAAAVRAWSPTFVGDAGAEGWRAPEGRPGAARSLDHRHHSGRLQPRAAVDGDRCSRPGRGADSRRAAGCLRAPKRPSRFRTCDQCVTSRPSDT